MNRMNAVLVLAVLASAYLLIGAAGGRAGKPMPDLIINSINAPGTFTLGVPTGVTVTTKNQGTKSAGASTTRLAAFGSQNAAVPSLAAGASHNSNFDVTCTSLGNFTLTATADVNGVVSESNEANNVTATTANRVAPPQPDLIISIMNAPDTFSSGVPTPVYVNTTNQGPASAGASTTRLSSTYGSEDASVPTLAAGTTYNSLFWVTCNNGGNNSSSFTLYAYADVYNAVSESNEGNNALSQGAICV